jgi:hypothetical protein
MSANPHANGGRCNPPFDTVPVTLNRQSQLNALADAIRPYAIGMLFVKNSCHLVMFQ